MWGLIQKRSLTKRREAVLQASSEPCVPFFIPRPFDTWRWPKRQLSFGAQPSFLSTGLLYPICETFWMDLRVSFCFSPIFCFLFPFGSRAIRYYISTRTTAAVQTSNSLENEGPIPSCYLLYVACTPRVACRVRLVLMCTLRASTFTSNIFRCCSFSFHLWDLHWWS